MISSIEKEKKRTKFFDEVFPIEFQFDSIKKKIVRNQSQIHGGNFVLLLLRRVCFLDERVNAPNSIAS